MHLAFMGFGLIAGSIARAIRANDLTAGWTMAAWSPSGAGPGRAAADGIIDATAASPELVLGDADLLVLGAPATRCLTLLDDLAGPWRHRVPVDMTITDVASTKAMLGERADAAGLRFVGGHPMAGLDQAGYGASSASLFVDRPWVIVPGRAALPADVERVVDLATACGARVVMMDAVAHDEAVAGVSHLPLIVAAAMVEAVAGTEASAPNGDGVRAWADAARLAAGGWRDSTRVARGDPAMGAAIAATNATRVAHRVRDLQAALDAWLADLERPGGPDEASMEARLESARARLDETR